MISQLFFQRSNGEYIEICAGCPEVEVLPRIQEFCRRQNYNIPYYRMWTTPYGTMYDVGSHTEFFLWGVLPDEDNNNAGVKGPGNKKDTGGGATKEKSTRSGKGEKS